MGRVKVPLALTHMKPASKRFISVRSLTHGGAAGENPRQTSAAVSNFQMAMRIWGGETQPDRDIPRYAELCRSGQWRLGDMITHTFALEEINEALAALEQGQAGRVVIDMRRRARS